MRIFLSYSTPDYLAAERIQEGLKARRPELDIYFAPKRNELGAYWIERLGTELEAADAIILVIGRCIGDWQQLEYYDALHRNRKTKRPLVIPILLTRSAPGLPFLDQFHRLNLVDDSFGNLIDLTLLALDGVKNKDSIPPWQRINPYPGLTAMGTQDAAYFFGREDLSKEILSRIEKHPDQIHALIGNSGVGKSSLAMAGVLAALCSRLWPGDWDHNWPVALNKSHRWPIVIMKPGETPVKALAHAFASLWLESPAEIEEEALKWRRLLFGESSLLALVEAALQQLSTLADAERPECLILYIDQAEELYSRAAIEEARRFSTLLADAVTDLKLIVMISLRSDYYGALQEDAALFKASHTIDVPPLNQTEIEQVIRLPAARLKVQFENPDMITLIAEATAREPGAMPMLSDLLSDAWRSMADAPGADGVLRFPFQIVDISRPLAEKVERFFAAHLNFEDDLKRLFTLKLAHVTNEGKVVRRRARRSDCSEAEWSLVEAMVERDWRLLSTGVEAGEPVVEVAHEALLRNWPRLGRWLDESREFLIWKGQLEPDRAAWENADATNRPPTLLTGLRLSKALEWRKSRRDDLTSTEIEFITDSASEAARIDRRRVWLQRALQIFAIVAAIATAVAFWQKDAAIQAEDQAIAQRNEAQHQADLAVATRLAMAAEKVLDENIGEITLAGLLSVESLKRMPTIEGQQVMRRVLEFTPEEFHEVETFSQSWVRNIQHSPDGELTAFSHFRSDGSSWKPAAGKVALIDTSSWRLGDDYDQQGRVWPVISSTGRWMTLAGYGRRLQVIDLQTQHLILDVHQNDMFDAAFGPDDRLYIARTDGVIEIREAPEWKIVGKLSIPLKEDRPSRVQIELSENGRQLLVLAPAQNPFLIAVDNGALIEFKGHQKNVQGGTISSSGNQLATYAWDGEMIVWDAQSGTSLGTYKHDAEITALAISLDGERIISATRAGAIFIRDAITGKVQRQLDHQDWINAIAISENGRYLATASDDRSAALWNLDNGEKLLSLPHDNEVLTIKFGANDQTIITGGKDGALRVFNTLSGEQQRRFEFSDGITAIAHNSISGVLAVGVRATEHKQAWSDLILVDRQTNRKVAHIEHNGGFSKIVFSPDSRTLVTTTGGSGDVKIWDTDTGTLIVAPKLQANSLFFTPDGARLIAGNAYEATVIVDAFDGRQLAAIGEPGGVETVNVAPDRRTITTFGQDLSFRSWDALTGEELWRRQSDRPDYRGLQISADGRRYADFSADGKHIEIGEVRTGQSVVVIPAGQRASSLLLSQDGRRLLITRTGLVDASDPEIRYSTVELWNVDAGKQLLKRKYEHQPFIFIFQLPDDRFAIIDRHTTKPAQQHGAMRSKLIKVVLDVYDAEQGARLWSAPLAMSSSTNVHIPKNRNDILLVKAGGDLWQIRAIATGKVITEVSEDGIGTILAAEATQDGKLILAYEEKSSFDKAIEVRDIKSGSVIKKIKVSAYIRDLAISKDGRLLFVTEESDYVKGVRIRRSEDLSEIGFIEMDSTPEIITPLADPDLLAVQSLSGGIRVWRASTGGEVHRFSHTFTAQGTQVASEASRAVTWQRASLRVWDTDTGNEIAQQLSHGPVSSLTVSPDGRTVAYLTDSKRTAKRGGDYKALVIWEPDSNDMPDILPMKNPSVVLFDPLGKRLAVLHHQDKTVQVLDAATLRTIENIRALPDSSVDGITFSTDGELLFVKESKNRKWGTRVFALDPLHEIARVDDSVSTESMPESLHVMTRNSERQWRSWTPLASDPDELLWKIHRFFSLHPILNTDRLLVSYDEKGAKLLNPNTNKHITILPAVDGQLLGSITIDEEGKHVVVAVDSFASGKDTGQVQIRNTEDGTEIARLQTGISMHALAFVNDGDGIVMSDTPTMVKKTEESALWLWKWRSGELLKLSRDNPINAIAVSPNGMIFATAEGAKVYDTDEPLGIPQIRIWDARDGKTLHQITQEDIVHDVAFSEDGQFLAVKMTRRIVVYQTKDWQFVKEFFLEGMVLAGGKVAFGADNRVVISGKGLQIWDLDDKEPHILRHSAAKLTFRFKFSRDRRWLATEEDGTLRVWNVKTGGELFRAKVSDSRIYSFAFSGNDGDTLVANVNGRLIRIPWKTEELIEEACRRFARSMTQDEWQRFLGEEPYDEKTCVGKDASGSKN